MKKIIALFLLLAISHIGQAQILVSYEKADRVDFSKFKTFQVYSLDVKNIPEFEPKKEGLNLLIEEINKQMISRGYEKVKENPDLIINVGVSITAEVQTRETTFRDAPMYIGQRNYHWESEEVIVREYNEGTVALDIVDTSENEMIWQAVASGILEKKREKNRKKIATGVQKLFKKYPVKPIE
ncbi:MAG: DUF4136 domain-containing protein [Maribacter sp.]|nr:DUF4136 domain-containing protein [Maribacter sp.]